MEALEHLKPATEASYRFSHSSSLSYPRSLGSIFPTPAPVAMGSPAVMEVLLRRVDTTNIVDTRQMSSGERFLVACFLGASIWNAVGMFPMIFLTFKRLWTLYFWAMILSTAGILICSASQIISVATPQVNTMINGIMSCIGWVFMVTGQSVVLYSRLHLLAITPRVLRLVLWMIIINGVTIHITGTVLTVGTRLQPPTSVPFTEAYRSVRGGRDKHTYARGRMLTSAWTQRIRENQHHDVLYTGNRHIRTVSLEVPRLARPLLEAQGYWGTYQHQAVRESEG